MVSLTIYTITNILNMHSTTKRNWIINKIEYSLKPVIPKLV